MATTQQHNDTTGRFKTSFIHDPEQLRVLNMAWGIPYVTPQLQSAIGKASLSLLDGGVNFHLGPKHDVLWRQLDGEGEFVGMEKNTKLFNEADARAIIAIAVAKGWDKDKNGITLHGNTAQKELLWLEAQRQGLKVQNFQPMVGSAAYQQWEAEKGAQPQQPAAEEETQLVHVEDRPSSARPRDAAPKNPDATDIKSRYVKPNGTARGRRPGAKDDIVDAEWREVKGTGVTRFGQTTEPKTKPTLLLTHEKPGPKTRALPAPKPE